MADQLMNQVQSLRKMIDKAKTQDKLNRHKLMNQLIILNTQTKPTLIMKKFSKKSISKKRKLNHDFSSMNNSLNNSEADGSSQNFSQNIIHLSSINNDK
jgi:hypothetical protein